jgi:hypothetical protein
VPEQLLNVLKLCLLILLYLFFLRVARAVWVEVNGPRPRRPRSARNRVPAGAVAPVATAAGAAAATGGTGRSRRQPKAAQPTKGAGGRGSKAGKGAKAAGGGAALVVVAPQEHAGRRHDLTDELTMGRAAGCRITLDDTYVSQLHARVFVREGGFYVEDLGSTNGTYLNRKKVSGPLLLKAGDQVQVGSTVLELVT